MSDEQKSARLTRRDFSIGLTGLAIGLCLRVPASAQSPILKYGAEAMAHGLRDDPRLFVNIDVDGMVTIVCHRAEMGQGIRTGLAMVVADELEADWLRVRVVQASADEERYGNQDTDGSRSMRHHFLPMRRVGAAARLMLRQAGANHWGVPLREVDAVNHEVVHGGSGLKASYGRLAREAAALAVPGAAELKLKRPNKFRYIGRPIGSLDALDMTTGRAIYAADMRLEGMLFAVIARAPVYGARIKSYDTGAALGVEGVIEAVEIEGEALPSEFQPLPGIAIVANNTSAALKGRERLSVEWDLGPNASYDSERYRGALIAEAQRPGKIVRKKGDVAAAIATGERFVADYYIPHQAHAAMETPAAMAVALGGTCEVWGCLQTPQMARDRIAMRLGLEPQKVTVHQTLLGGGFGRKSQPDFAVEAAVLSRAVGGRPVQVLWTREDDLCHDYFGTVSVQHLEASLSGDGRVTTWLHRSLAPTITSLFGPDTKREAPFELGQGLIDTPFDVPHLQIESGRAPAHTRIGWFRSVSNVPHAFAAQSFVSELANAAGRDDKDFLLELIGPPRIIEASELSTDWWNYTENPALYPIDTGRLRRVIEMVANAASWGTNLAPGWGAGIAAHRSFGSYAAAIVKVSWSAKKGLRIESVDIALDCGPQVNPDRIRAQMEGAAIQGISIALLSEVAFKDGRPAQTNFDSFKLARMDIIPKEIGVHIVPTDDFDQPLGGVGEPGLPPIAPALVNAVFHATGKRIRALPIGSQLGE